MILVRSVIYFIYMMAGTLIVALIALPTLLWRPAAMAVFRAWTWYQRLGYGLICGIRIEIRGTQPTGPALIAAKHHGLMDIIGPASFLPDPCFVMKRELLYIPIFGWWAWACRMVWVDRQAHAAALKKMLSDVQDRMRHDRQVIIFPEGTRVKPGETGSYKPGIAALYRDLELPVTPCATNSGVHWPAKGWLRRPGVVVFEYLEPIPAGLKRGEFMRTLEERIETASARLFEEGV